MGEKKFDIFNSSGIIGFFFDGAESWPFKVVENSFEVESEDIVDENGDLIVRAPSNTPASFECSIPSDPLIDILSNQALDEIESVLMYANEHINRPKNLKHPNKKRARRVWNKWRKRYGVKGGHGLVIPKAKVDVSVDGETANITIHAQDCHKEG